MHTNRALQTNQVLGMVMVNVREQGCLVDIGGLLGQPLDWRFLSRLRRLNKNQQTLESLTAHGTEDVRIRSMRTPGAIERDLTWHECHDRSEWRVF